MFIKKFKKKCGVRGCKNTSDVYLISKRREMGNTVAMCRDCIKEALESTKHYTEPEKAKKVEKPLFPHPELDVTISSAYDKEPKPIEVIESITAETNISVAEDTVTTEEKTTTPKGKNTTGNKSKTSKK